ncbi:MAG TPA: alpha/beta fold hydrolase [Candidatus Nitrosotenuis sp.]|nr:alpha/beta fold hydrolase [Candidatus Nitrosotenuis sp.]
MSPTLALRKFDVPMRRTPGHHLRVVEAGQGQPVLMVHGAAGSHQNWIHQIRALGRSFRVVAPDLRGHGDSPWPGPSTIEDFYHDLEDLVEELELGPRLHLVAHSFGGCISALYASRHPGQVRTLALLNTAGQLPRGLAYRFLEEFSHHADLLRRHYPWMIASDSLVSTWLLRHTLKQWDIWDVYPRLEMPSLVILGALDPLVPVSYGRRMASLLPRATLRVLPTGGHVSMIEQPAQVTTWLEELLRSG